MKKLLFFALAILLAALSFGTLCPSSGGPAAPSIPSTPFAPRGSLCDLGNNPAATLLVPYFEVDSSNPLGIDTLIGIINMAPYYTVAHVVVWNVDSVEVFDFNIVLTGFDVATFSMKDILINGVMPNNCCVTNQSRFRVGSIDCDGDGLYFGGGRAQAGLEDYCMHLHNTATDIACYSPSLIAPFLPYWQCMLSEASYFGASINYIGYLTIDTNITCNGGFPTYQCYIQPNTLDVDPAIASYDHGIMEHTNVLMGDIIYYDHTNMVSDGMPAVHIEAFGESNLATGHSWGMSHDDFVNAGILTFYHKYYDSYAMDPYDAREPLPIRWAFRYIGNEAFNGGTWVDVWRSHDLYWGPYQLTINGTGPCLFWGGMGYSLLWDRVHYTFPDCLYGTHCGLHVPTIWCYDEEENTAGGQEGPSGDYGAAGFDRLFFETQREPVATPDWPLVAESGFCAIAFETDAMFDTGPGFGASFDQSWLNVRYSALNKYTVGLSGFSYINGCFLDWDDIGKYFDPSPTH